MKLLERLRTRLLEGNLGHDVYVFHMPAHERMAVLLLARKAAPVNHYLPGYYKSDYQAIIRAPSSDIAGGQALADQVMVLLSIEQESQLADIAVKYSLPRHQPFMYPVSNGDLIEWSINFDAAFVDK